MPDPVSNHDIEDVLTSIRRLVAQGNKEATLDQKADVADLRPQSPPAGNDRLVLTADFRVADSIPDSSPVAGLQSPPQFETPDDEIEEATEVTVEAAADQPEVYWTEEEDAETPDEVNIDRVSLEATIAELEAAVTETSDEWEPDGSEDAVDSIVTSAFLQKLDARQAQRTPEQTVTEVVSDHIADTIAEEIAQNIPFEEVSFAKTEVIDDEEPDNDNLAEAPDVEADFEDVAVPVEKELTFSHTKFSEVYDPIAEETADAAEMEDGDIYGDDLAPDDDPMFGSVAPSSPHGQLVDPDALRLMVGEMIREELQGEMGERITRNVRKLVRREINRVITEQDV